MVFPGCQGGLVAGKGHNQTPHFLPIALHPVNLVNVLVDDRLQVTLGDAHRLRRGGTNGVGPATRHHKFRNAFKGQLRNRRVALSLKQTSQRHLTIRLAELVLGHGAHGNANDAPGPAMSRPIGMGILLPAGSRGAREHKLPLLRGPIALKSHGVPQLGNVLPFIDQTRPGTLKGNGRLQLGQTSVLKVAQRVGHADFRDRMVLRRRSLAAPLWPLDDHGTESLHVFRNGFISNTGNVIGYFQRFHGPGLHLVILTFFQVSF